MHGFRGSRTVSQYVVEGISLKVLEPLGLDLVGLEIGSSFWASEEHWVSGS